MELLHPTSAGKAARVDVPRSFSYAEIRTLSAGVASKLAAKFGSGKRIALLMEPGPDFIATFVGVIHSGSCVVVLSPLHTESESAYYCNDSDAVALICSESYRERANRILHAQGDSHGTLLIGLDELQATSPEAI
ncbi:MAG: AMP-binding protein, partial [Bdellovibrionia bacterium]